MFFSLSFLLAAISSVSAHGVVTQMFIDGAHYPGNTPNGKTNPSIIRQINDASPVKGANNPNILCGPGAGPASIIGAARAGSTIKFDWTGADLSKWPHNTGAMFTYMASCGNTPCNDFDAKQAKWFKIQQVGRKAKGQEWAQADLMKGATADITLPKNLAPGQYLIRHEIIALHLANQMGGAEFYPSCAQIQVDGNGNGFPLDSELVSFPGAYSDSDPGIFTQSAFDVNADYPFPGPPIAAFVNGGQSGTPPPTGNSAATAGGTKPSSTGAAKPQSTGGTSGATNTGSTKGTCKLVKQKRSAHRPRSFSRVMRRLNLHGSIH